jgi:hypothetical protein
MSRAKKPQAARRIDKVDSHFFSRTFQEQAAEQHLTHVNAVMQTMDDVPFRHWDPTKRKEKAELDLPTGPALTPVNVWAIFALSDKRITWYMPTEAAIYGFSSAFSRVQVVREASTSEENCWRWLVRHQVDNRLAMLDSSAVEYDDFDNWVSVQRARYTGSIGLAQLLEAIVARVYRMEDKDRPVTPVTIARKTMVRLLDTDIEINE